MMVLILDSTLREGEQTPGVYFDNHIKLAIGDHLSRIGIDIIEAGHPAISDEIESGVRQLARNEYNVTIGAHARSVKRDVDLAIDCGIGFLGIFYCVSNSRLNQVFRKSLSKAIEDLCDVISYAKERDPGLVIRYTPEDTVRSDFHDVIEASVAAVKAGADIISVADTTGYMIPGTDRSMYDYVLRLKNELALRGVHPRIAVHCHNDRGLAFANALEGYMAGAEIIDVSVMGIGERAGIVDLAQLMATLRTDFHEGMHWKLELLPELYTMVSNFTGIPIPVNLPITGKNAFTHCAGIHTHAALRNPVHYQSLDPSIVGRNSDICLDHMAGLSSVIHSMERIGEPGDRELVAQVLKEIKIVGTRGRVVDPKELRHIVSMCRSRWKGPNPLASPVMEEW